MSNGLQGFPLVACTWNLGNKEDDISVAKLPCPGDFSWLIEICSRTQPSLLVLGLQEVHPSHVSALVDLVLDVLRPLQLPGRIVALSAEAANSYSPILVFEWQKEGVDNLEGPKIESLPFTFDKQEVCSKGCIIVRLQRCGLQLCLANAHLEAGHAKLLRRNGMFSKITAACPCTPRSMLVLAGDLNYRIEGRNGFGTITEPTKARPDDFCAQFDAEFEEITNLCEAGQASSKLFPERCQLRQAMAQEADLQGFEEGEVTFAPTYKRSPDSVEPGVLLFDRSERRLPGWCDRILWRRGCDVAVTAMEYNSIESALFSDHRPVYAVLQVSPTSSADG